MRGRWCSARALALWAATVLHALAPSASSSSSSTSSSSPHVLVGCLDGAGHASPENCGGGGGGGGGDGGGGYVANVKSATGALSGDCWRNAFFHGACDAHDSGVAELALTSSSLTRDDRLALVPQGLCGSKLLESLPDERFARIEAREIGRTGGGDVAVRVRLPDTWGPHELCVLSRTGAAEAVVGGVAVEVGCPAGWFGQAQSQRERLALMNISRDNWAAPNVLSRTFDVAEAPLGRRAAAEFCAAKGMRLCSADELVAGEGRAGGVAADDPAARPTWSGTACDIDYATFSKRAGFIAALPEDGACAAPDCAESYAGERCWHDYRLRARCAGFDPANPQSRHSCPAGSDWRLHWTAADVVIPKLKVGGRCLNGSPCGSNLNLTVGDGTLLGSLDEATLSAATAGPVPCAAFNESDSVVHDAWGNADLLADGKLLNHGARAATCTPHEQPLSRVTCCRGSMPMCARCPFGLESPARSVGVEQCSLCVKQCGNTTCACEDADAATLVAAAADAQQQDRTAAAERFEPIVAAGPGDGPGRRRRRELLPPSQSEPEQLERQQAAAKTKTKVSRVLSSECLQDQYFDSSAQQCMPCQFGLGSPAGSVGAGSCTACLVGCTTSCGRESACRCSAGDVAPGNLNTTGPLRERAPQELAFGQPAKGAVAGVALSHASGVVCRCLSNCSALAICDVQAIDCTVAPGGSPPFWLQGGSAPADFGFGAPTPVAFCADIPLDPAADSPAADDCCELPAEDDYFFLPTRGAMGIPYDELLHPLNMPGSPVFESASGAKYLVVSESGRDPLAADATGACP